MFARRIARAIIVSLAVLILQLSISHMASAQAWVPSKGEGSVTFTYQKVDVRDHFNALGEQEDRGRIHTHNTIMSLEYGLTDRLALDFDVAYISSKFDGQGRRRPHGPVDDGFFHPTFQDVHFDLRYNAFTRPLVVTPFIGMTIPTHDYEVRGHSAVGRGFKELLLGVNVGRQLDPILPNAYAHVRYSFAILKRFADLNLNRSNADLEIGWLANKSIALRFIGSWARTHGGFEFPGDIHDEHDFDIHDRVARVSFLQLGGGVTFSVKRSFDLHVAYAPAPIYARNSHGDAGIVVGVTWRFSRGFANQIAANSPTSKLPTLLQGTF